MGEDWEDWLEEHFRIYDEYCDPETKAKSKYRTEALANFLSGESAAFSDMKRLLELEDAFGYFCYQGGYFAGIDIDNDAVIHLPLRRRDIDEIHRALGHLIDEEIVEEIEVVERKDERTNENNKTNLPDTEQELKNAIYCNKRLGEEVAEWHDKAINLEAKVKELEDLNQDITIKDAEINEDLQAKATELETEVVLLRKEIEWREKQRMNLLFCRGHCPEYTHEPFKCYEDDECIMKRPDKTKKKEQQQKEDKKKN